MKKQFRLTSVLLVFSLLISCFGLSAAAASPEPSYTFDGGNMSWVLCDEEGNIVQRSDQMSRVIYNYNVAIPNGYTMYFYASPNSKTFFSLAKGTTINFTVNWSSAAIFIMGYDVTSLGNGTTQVYMNTISKTSHTETFEIPRTAAYVFWVTNMSTDTKTLTQATIVNA